MQWLEQVFGMSPDGGSGVAELLMVVAPMVIVGLMAVLRLRWTRALKAAV
jgi:hypothetical protein